jgi:proteic killer suppression protein
MEIRFDKEYLEELYLNGKTKNKKYRFQPQVVKKYQKRIDTLAGVTRIEELFTLNSLNFEALESSGNYSIRIDYHYRLEFQVSNSESEPIITICLIMDITNHYE